MWNFGMRFLGYFFIFIFNSFFRFFRFWKFFNFYMWNFGFFMGSSVFFSSRKEEKRESKIYDLLKNAIGDGRHTHLIEDGFFEELKLSGYSGVEKTVGCSSLFIDGLSLRYEVSYLIDGVRFPEFPEIKNLDFESLNFSVLEKGGVKVGHCDIGGGYFACKAVYDKAVFFFIVKSEKGVFLFPLGFLGLKSSCFFKLCDYIRCYFVS